MPCSVHFKATTSVYIGSATFVDELWIGHSDIIRKSTSLEVTATAPAPLSAFSSNMLIRADIDTGFNSSSTLCNTVATSELSTMSMKMSFGLIDFSHFNWTEQSNTATWGQIVADSYTGYDLDDRDNLITVYYRRGTQHLLGASGTFLLPGGLVADMTMTVNLWEQQTELAASVFAVPSLCIGTFPAYPVTPQSFIDSCLATAPTTQSSSNDGNDDDENTNAAPAIAHYLAFFSAVILLVIH